MVDRLGEVVAPRRFSAMVLGGFATGSLLLAAIGLYGLLVFTVGERLREIAVRLGVGGSAGGDLVTCGAVPVVLVVIALIACALLVYRASARTQ